MHAALEIEGSAARGDPDVSGVPCSRPFSACFPSLKACLSAVSAFPSTSRLLGGTATGRCSGQCVADGVHRTKRDGCEVTRRYRGPRSVTTQRDSTSQSGSFLGRFPWSLSLSSVQLLGSSGSQTIPQHSEGAHSGALGGLLPSVVSGL